MKEKEGCVQHFPSLNSSAVITGLLLYVCYKLWPGRSAKDMKSFKRVSEQTLLCLCNDEANRT